MALALTYSDVNEAYKEMHIVSQQFCGWENTRNGKAFAFQVPVLVTHLNPGNRVLFDPVRDANPFFHYMEAIWILSGSDDVHFPAHFAKQIAAYSDDGETLHGAYGYRMLNNFQSDQVELVIDMLRADKTTRRAVIALWSPDSDLGYKSGKDLPCNTHLYFRVVNDCLEMTVCNRNNDMVWGMLGANIVHFSILQEYIAAAVNLDTGPMHQFSNNLHIYENHIGKFDLAEDKFYYSPEVLKRIEFTPDSLNFSESRRFVRDFQDSELYPYKSPILRENAIPMLTAWNWYKLGKFEQALNNIAAVYDSDWREACTRWLQRRAV